MRLVLPLGVLLSAVAGLGTCAVSSAPPSVPAAQRPPGAVRASVPAVQQSSSGVLPAVAAVTGPRAAGPVPPGRAAAPTSTGWAALDAAVVRIPGYPAGRPATWFVSGASGHWGSTLLPDETIAIDPAVPVHRLDAVVRHEWAHVLALRAYGGDVPRMVRELDAAFGGGRGGGPSGLAGVERAADCLARQLGADWTHYTPCRNAVWQARARALLRGSAP